MAEQVDPNTRFTGGVKVVFKKPEERYCSGMDDQSWGKTCIGHISLADQPLKAFVEAVLWEKGLAGRSFEIVSFAPEIGLIIVNADTTSRKMDA